jgi:uncharacterized protein YprB with RNaseH-like and TPR domain
LFPRRTHWRLYREFSSEAIFFDIETDGREQNRPTMVSLFDSEGVQLFIDGRNLDQVPEALARRRLWVTFNGSCFDVPVLKAFFQSLPEPELHIDLRFHFQSLGMGGGLKRLEERLGLARPSHLKGTNGWDAVLLWRAFQEEQSLDALRLLAEYNLYDAFQLRSLMDQGYNLAVDALRLNEPPLPVFQRGEILYDVSRVVLELGQAAQADPDRRESQWDAGPSIPPLRGFSQGERGRAPV